MARRTTRHRNTPAQIVTLQLKNQRNVFQRRIAVRAVNLFGGGSVESVEQFFHARNSTTTWCCFRLRHAGLNLSGDLNRVRQCSSAR